MGIVYNSMNTFPEQEKGETFSKTVLVFDLENDYSDHGFYDFEKKKWYILGDFQMKLNCWCEIPMPEDKNAIINNQDFKPVMTD